VLDDEGVVREHRMTLRRDGSDTVLRTGERGFAIATTPGRVLIGERSESATSLTMVDTVRVCRLWQRHLDGLAYDITSAQE